MKEKEIIPAVLAVIRRDGKFLLTKRHIKSRFEAGKWGFVGEAIKYSEHPQDALKRGIKEETNLDLKSFEFLDVGSFLFESAEKDRHAIILIYLCDADGEVVLNHEAEDFGWFTIPEMGGMELIKGNEKVLGILESKL